ncbi:MAG TPA: hypothetical protein VMB71_04600 [Acetobacteraceae bacterium]|nr:hypothetical protein [Acetobacteraceae bacterium]
MSLHTPRPRLLPATIAVMGLLLALKTMGLLREVMAGSAVAAEASGEQPKDPVVPAPAPAAAAHGVGAVPASAAPAGAAAAQAGTAQAAQAASPVSDAERGLLLDLRHRREQLDTRQKDLDQRDAVMQAAEQKLTARVQELNALQAKLEALEAARESRDSANWQSLVHIYEDMKPRDAAAIFDALDMHVLLGVLDRMQDRKAAPILAAMQPDRARLATQLLAELRTREVTPAGAAPASAQTPPQTDPKG